MRKKTVAVIMGGPSAEREVSLVTGRAICENLDKKRYNVIPLEMAKDGSFLFVKNGKKMPYDLYKKRGSIDVAFIALHGTVGEDGAIQGLLECYGIPYTGSDVLSSALCMNKVFAAQVYFANGLPHPEFIHLKRGGWKDYRKEVLKDVNEKIGFPAVVKPVDQGSAVGVTIVKNEAELIKAIDTTVKKFPWLMVQKFIAGKEATCGVLEENDSLLPLPPTHILPKMAGFYDYKSKYKAGGSAHVCPADFPRDINEKIQKLALYAHKAMRCSGMSRTDFIYADEKNAKIAPRKVLSGHETSQTAPPGSGKLYILETNTIPGMTPTSLLPEAAAKADISFTKMLDMIIAASKK